ncbi:H+-transporting two-sector ATPase, C (AC39) subunit [Methanospirillum hungatei JF-1]|uniref:A-type ATP synthase subunit C n=1 Tax=Methanospirillum hungatei JF-1 (strain ATCC 27890 / DSM 864 / NBRC 100397 / JF-1) TaxID=323259 RepID=Q2FL51_METHJ|nr:V-type ATPase subunit [Methanospirillum hungatei]ABD41482.1 H+-transporting two-sector ATPase, C (AC39) subunit [Methanospirillum hungatei JF-1]MBP9009192.1 V-type ATPase subunit [Methanospirillum sp.]
MDSGYVNARIRGMYSRLLDKKSLSNLILKPDISSLITALEETSYHEDLERALVGKSGLSGIEEALRLNLIRTIQKISEFLQGEKGERYILIFSSRWDIHNLKTILRGKRIKVPTMQIRENLVPAGEFDESLLSELLKQPDVKSVIDLLATWEVPYAIPLTQAFPDYNAQGDLFILENALDRFYYERALSLVGGKSVEERKIREIIGTEIDLINIKSLLMMFRDHVDPEDAQPMLLDGGKVFNRKKLKMLLNLGSIASLIEYLEETPYRFLSDLRSTEGDTVKISTYQHLLDEYLIRHAVRLYRGDPLSVTVVIGYLWAKYTEIMNLRIIARCKNALIPPEDMEAEMVYV